MINGRLMLLGLAAGVSLPAMAHDRAAPVRNEPATLLTVSARGEVTRDPEVAVFHAGVVSNGQTAAEAMEANAAEMARVFAALKQLGIAEKDIQTSNLSLTPVHAPVLPLAVPRKTPLLRPVISYRVNNSVTVHHRKVEDFGKVIDALGQAGANNISGPSFRLDDAEPAMDEARAAALEIARKRAAFYARRAGMKLGRMVSINEGRASEGSSGPMLNLAMNASKAATPVAAGELSVAANLTVVFELTD